VGFEISDDGAVTVTSKGFDSREGAARLRAITSDFVAPMPLLAVALMVCNDRYWKPRFRNALTGKISDLAICFFLPLLVHEVSGWVVRSHFRARLFASAALSAVVFTSLELDADLARWACRWLAHIGAILGLHGTFRMTEDPTDLVALVMIPLASLYALRRERARASVRRPLGLRQSRSAQPNAFS
jgi:hypothetical protein